MVSERFNFTRLVLRCLTLLIISQSTGVKARGITSPLVDGNVPVRLKRSVTISPTSKCVNKVGSATFYGHRVNQDKDNTFVFLYDNNGVFVGLQIRFRQDEVLGPGNPYKFSEIPMYQKEYVDGIAYFVLTAYFMDPSMICATGRTSDDFKRFWGSGKTSLYFQNGPLPTDLFVVPNNRREALTLGFAVNELYPLLGYHYYPNVTQWKNDDCKSIPPAFLLYNYMDRLIGFGYQWLGFSRSEPFEHPTSFALTSYIGAGQVPQCLVDAVDRSSGGPGVTSIEMYFDYFFIPTLGPEWIG